MTFAPSPPNQPAHAHGVASTADDRWSFQWVDAPLSGASAHVSGQLRWRGIDLSFMADGLRGIDGRLAAPSMQSLSASLQQLVLAHFAAECLQALAHGPLADLELVSIEWHAQPRPMDGGFEFLVRRPGVPAATPARVTVADAAGRAQWVDAVASLGWPLPAMLAFVQGQLVLGSLCLTADECAQLAVGDLVWVDDAELSPQGLRVHFEAAHGSERRGGWIKRSELRVDASAPAPAQAQQAEPQADGMRRFTVVRGATVERGWLHGAVPLQRMSKPASAMTWTACEDAARPMPRHETAVFEGRLVVVARRIGLRITRVQQPVLRAAAVGSTQPQEA
jgi:hypothetical protein